MDKIVLITLSVLKVEVKFEGITFNVNGWDYQLPSMEGQRLLFQNLPSVL